VTARGKEPDGPRLGAAERRTQAALDRHPAPDDLAWGDVIALLERLAEVRPGRKGVFRVTRNGVMITLHAPRARTALTADELAEVKRFLERSAEGVSVPIVPPETRLVVALEPGGARIHRIVPAVGEPRRLEPFAANGYAAHLRATGGPGGLGDVGGAAGPVRLGFYTELARALRGADEILLVAAGADASTALAALRAELRGHAEVHRAVVGALVLAGGRRSTSEERVLARVREFYAGRP
jgi:hypothetical protein